jgi:hypothetical protein
MVQSADDPLVEARTIVQEMRRAIQTGQKPWHVALLEAIARWRLPEEEVAGRTYRYLVGGEAFDWLLLAERLCLEIADLVPQDELEALLFRGCLPSPMDEDEFRRLIGAAKYRAHLNFVYGVLVEEAIQLAVHDEVVKEQMANVWQNGNADDEACLRIYGATRAHLLRCFREERGILHSEWVDVDEWREFTYWLFKRRLRYCDPARVASDTRKGLRKLAQLRQALSSAMARGVTSWPPEEVRV